MKRVLGLCLLGLFSSGLWASQQLDQLNITDRGVMQIGITPAEGQIRGDILYFHGHGDRLQNHRKTFEHWALQGFRVLSFDLPQHGESQLGPLDSYSMDELLGLAQQLEESTRQQSERPLILAGWSFGGLLATRLAQQSRNLRIWQRPLAGLLLIAPGVSVLPLVGGDGFARLQTLTRNVDLDGVAEPSPSNPLTTPLFSMRLLHAAWLARQQSLPHGLPVAIILAGDQSDWYVDSVGVREWALAQRSAGSRLKLWQCPEARHALELEPYPIGHWLREYTSSYLDSLLSPTQTEQAVAHQWNRAFAADCYHVVY